MWKPNSIVDSLARDPRLWLGSMPDTVKTHIKYQANMGWRFFPVDQSCGRCFYAEKVITIPLWAIQDKRIGYLVWYVSHEIAHIYAGYRALHGPIFMEWLKKICPKEFQHYEIGYKPRNAVAAGIRKPRDIDPFLGE